MTRRSTIVVALLTFFTCGLYGLWFLYKTTAELRDETGKEELNPGLDLILMLITLGLWSVVVGYRNSEIIHGLMLRRGQTREDRSLLVFGLGVLGWLSGIGALVVVSALLNEQYRAYIHGGVHGGGSPVGFDAPSGPPAPSTPVSPTAGLLDSSPVGNHGSFSAPLPNVY